MRDFYRNKKVLITGHSGFKGAWLSQILINWGADVIGISLPPARPNLFESLNLDQKVQKNYFFDIRNFDKVKEVLINTKPEIIFHLAAQALVKDGYDYPLETHSINILGTLNLLQAIKEVGGVKSVVIITTDKVYENKEWHYPYREIDSLGGYDPYSASKAAADIVANSYIQSFFNPNNFGQGHNTLVSIVRAGNVIGGGDWARNRLVPDMIRAFFERQEAVVIKNPQAIRPWQHVLEPLRGYLMLGERLYRGDKHLSSVWNFGPNGDGLVCVEEMVKKIILLLGRGSYQVIKNGLEHETELLKLDINKAISVLHWRPKWQLDDCLKATCQWYAQFYTNPELIDDLTSQQIKAYFED